MFDKRRPCSYFRANGSCTYGKRCKFSHEVSHSQDPGNSGPHRQPHGRLNGQASKAPPIDGKLQKWKRLMAQASQLTRPSTVAVGEFFKTGLELMSGDVGAAQDVIKLFVTDEGLSFVRDVADRNVPQATSEREKMTLWNDQMRPLFRLITHPRIAASAVLEQQVAALFNFVFGLGGSRMQRMLNFVAVLVEAWPKVGEIEGSRVDVIELTFAVLVKVIDCNTTSVVCEGFQPVVDRLSPFLQNTSEPGNQFSCMQATKYLEYIQRRLDIGHQLPHAENVASAPLALENFVLRKDFPGRLSADGPRHDNDHADISDIRIMPTFEEIISPRADYLPTNDLSSWHQQGIQGRLDREFRLIREDTVGQLRDAIWAELQAIQNRTAAGHSNRAKPNIRTSTYYCPTPIRVQFVIKGGMDFLVQFDQPEAVKTCEPLKRHDWWVQSKRLQEGALVCLLDERGSVLYFVVSETTDRIAPERDQDLQANQKAPRFTLAGNKDFAYVSLCLVDPTKRNIGEALRWYQPVGRPVRRYLIEFPGVLLASFKYTLEALQAMHRKPDMPFTNLIAPLNGV